MNAMSNILIENLEIKDLRFPTSRQKDGSDAMVNSDICI